MKRSKPESKINEAAPLRASRRNFARSVAATAFAAATAPLASSVLSAQTPSTTKETVAPPKPQATPAPSSAATAPTQPLVEAYAEVARVRFGGQVTPEQMAQIKKDLAGNVRAADRLRAVKLQNADEPDFVFKA